MWILFLFCFTVSVFSAEPSPNHAVIPGIPEFRPPRNALDHPVGKCCYQDLFGSCFQLTELECVYYGGNWQAGDCAVPCPAADWGRCCLPNPSVACFNITPFECYGQRGHGWLPWTFCNGQECGTVIYQYCCGADSACFAQRIANGEAHDEACGNCNGSPRTLRYPEPDPCLERASGRCCYENYHCVQCDSVMCTNFYSGQWTANVSCFGAVCTPPWIDSPQNLVIKPEFPNIHLSWSGSMGAVNYLVYRSAEQDTLVKPVHLIGSTQDSSFTDWFILSSAGERIFYAVTATIP